MPVGLGAMRVRISFVVVLLEEDGLYCRSAHEAADYDTQAASGGSMGETSYFRLSQDYRAQLSPD